MTNPDIGAFYGAARKRLTALVTEDGVDLERMVPATPAWRVHDVIAHVTGVATDVINKNGAGAPGEAWTAAQVARGRDRTLGDLLIDWEKFGAQLQEFLSSPAGAPVANVVMDVHSHESDVRNAFGMPTELPSDFLAWSMGRIRDGFHSGVAEAGLPPVSIKVTDAELFRARLGRRTAQEVCAYDWSLDPKPYLETFFLFGPAEQSIGERL